VRDVHCRLQHSFFVPHPIAPSVGRITKQSSQFTSVLATTSLPDQPTGVALAFDPGPLAPPVGLESGGAFSVQPDHQKARHCFTWLALPQTVRVPSSSPVLDEVAKRLSFATPTAAGLSPPVATIALAVDALNDLDAATFAALGTKTSTDLLSDYSPACYPLFSA
jgi:hypothetical protein